MALSDRTTCDHRTTGFWLCFLGVFQIAAAYIFLITGCAGTSRALEVSLLLLLEPVLNTIWAWLLHGETPGPLGRLRGCAVILAATVAWSLRQADRGQT